MTSVGAHEVGAASVSLSYLRAGISKPSTAAVLNRAETSEKLAKQLGAAGGVHVWSPGDPDHVTHERRGTRMLRTVGRLISARRARRLLAFEDASLGHALVRERCEVHGSWGTVEDPLGHPEADRRGRLEARPAVAAVEEQPVRPGGSEERPLVGRRQAVLAGVRRPERAVDEARHRRTIRSAARSWNATAAVPVSRSGSPPIWLSSSSPTSTSSVPSGRKYISFGMSMTTGIGRGTAAGTPEVARVVAPDGQRQVQPGQGATAPAQRPAALTTTAASIVAGGRDDAANPPADDGNRRDRRTLDQARSPFAGRPHERARGHRRVGVAGRGSQAATSSSATARPGASSRIAAASTRWLSTPSSR